MFLMLRLEAEGWDRAIYPRSFLRLITLKIVAETQLFRSAFTGLEELNTNHKGNTCRGMAQ